MSRATPPRGNRVNPFGLFDATEARGTVMGNRGRLHDSTGRMTGKTHSHRAWIICRLQFRERHRTINTPGRYTELFFADEATAMAAGHRPCAECQRARYDEFKRAWRRAYGIAPDVRLPAADIDAELHAGRIDRWGRQLTHTARLGDLPSGVFVTFDCVSRRPFAWWKDALHPWSHDGYGAPTKVPKGSVTVLTPAPLVLLIAAGYTPFIRFAAEK